MSTPRKRWHLSTPAIAGIVALVSGLVTLVFTLSPSLKPDPGEAINAKLSVLTVEPHARYRDYLQRLGDAGPPTKKIAPEVLDEVGYIVNLGVVVNGRKRRSLALRKADYVARSGRRYSAAEDVGTFRSDTPSDGWVAPVFVVDPGFRFFERFELVDRGIMLAIADTRVLRPQ
jgi:hypothetical protein